MPLNLGIKWPRCLLCGANIGGLVNLHLVPAGGYPVPHWGRLGKGLLIPGLKGCAEKLLAGLSVFSHIDYAGAARDLTRGCDLVGCMKSVFSKVQTWVDDATYAAGSHPFPETRPGFWDRLWSGAEYAYNHVVISGSVCVFGCVNLSFQGGHVASG